MMRVRRRRIRRRAEETAVDSAVDSAAAARVVVKHPTERSVSRVRHSPHARDRPPRLRRSVFARLRRRLRRAFSHSTIASRLLTGRSRRRRRRRRRPLPTRAALDRVRVLVVPARLRARRVRVVRMISHAHRAAFARRHRVRATSFDTSSRVVAATTTRAARERPHRPSRGRMRTHPAPPH